MKSSAGTSPRLRGPGRRDPAAAPAVLSGPRSLRSFLEVRVGGDRVDVVEFYSHGQARRLRGALRALGLEVREEFDSPCG
ncbi:MAG TPA: hypothetical protein DGR79_07230 [Clostridiales bacterium]|nr:hypothetical protein [Clostridiales bacterium]